MHKHNPILTKLLTWLLISTQILALVGTATMTAIQPTAQLVQETAQQASLGNWIANAATDLTAASRRLWSALSTVAAQITASNCVSGSLTLWYKADAGTAYSFTLGETSYSPVRYQDQQTRSLMKKLSTFQS